MDLGLMPKLAQQAGGKGLDGIQHGYCGVVFEAFASMHVACAQMIAPDQIAHLHEEALVHNCGTPAQIDLSCGTRRGELRGHAKGTVPRPVPT